MIGPDPDVWATAASGREIVSVSRHTPQVERTAGAGSAKQAEPTLAAGTVERESDSSRTRTRLAGADVESWRNDLVEAATDDAVDRLYEQIATEPVGANHRVADVLEVLPRSARAQFRSALQESQQVGGPRFSDSRVTQIQLQARGDEVGRILVKLVSAHQDHSPVSIDELTRTTEGWNNRNFVALGGSVHPEVAELLTPPRGAERRGADLQNRAWSRVDTETTRETIVAAQEDAIEQVVVLIRPIVVLDERPDEDGPSAASTDASRSGGEASDQEEADRPPYTLGDVLETGSVEEDLRHWLAQRPIMRLRFEDDREIAIRISLDADDVTTFLVEHVGEADAQLRGMPTVSEDQWRAVEALLQDVLPGTLTGRALAASRIPDAPDDMQVLALPADPPDWTRMPIVADGTADGREGKLLLARKAGTEARENLRQMLLDLPIDENLTVADLVDRRPELADRIDRVVREARISRTEYSPEGDATVHVTAEGQYFWHLLNR